jgi:diguanylate cyclase (GGDEF)-like protein/PAS domain S-box-containing protein
VQFASRALCAWWGLPLEEVRGKTLQELYGAHAYAQFAQWTDRALAGEDVHYERQATRPDGAQVWLSVNLRPHRGTSGKVLGYFSCALEVEELKRTHDALGRALDQLATHMENTPLAVIEWSPDLAVKRWSPQAEAIFGWTTRGGAGPQVRRFRARARGFARDGARAHARVGARARQAQPRAVAQQHQGRARDLVPVVQLGALRGGGKLTSILSLAEDVTARVDAEEQLRQAAVHDALTGLPNRNSLAARLEHAIVRVNRSGDRIALLFIDLDRFKKVNDTLGHAAGDEVLRQAAARIRACVREVDTVARLGGDEFVVLLETDVRLDTPASSASAVRDSFGTPFDWKGTEVRCGASVGVSLYPDHARDSATLLASADGRCTARRPRAEPVETLFPNGWFAVPRGRRDHGSRDEPSLRFDGAHRRHEHGVHERVVVFSRARRSSRKAASYRRAVAARVCRGAHRRRVHLARLLGRTFVTASPRGGCCSGDSSRASARACPTAAPRATASAAWRRCSPPRSSRCWSSSPRR